MGTADMTGWLGFGTLAIALVIAIVLWLRFMRKPENRHPMDGQRERHIGEIRDEAGEGANESPDRPRY
jgi:membrane protein implicated in regulation of membrane protease activity